MSYEELNVKFYTVFNDFYNALPTLFQKWIFNSPFQYKEWQQLLYDELKMQKRRADYIGAILFMDDEPVVGGHFFFKNSGRTKGLFILGSGGETDYHDLIYFRESVTVEQIHVLINQTLDKTEQKIFIASQISLGSPLSEWAKAYGVTETQTNDCASIAISGTFEEYWNSLSKSVRQNIRTAKNRMVKDEHSFNFRIYEKQALSPEFAYKLQTIYESRRIVKNQKIDLKQKLFELLRTFRKKKYNIMLKSMIELSNIFISVIYIDECIAGYCFGLTDIKDNIYVMQVAIDINYSRYSPGMVMLIATIEKLFNSGKVSNFDLTNGNEHYKYLLGAKTHKIGYYEFRKYK